MPKPKPTKHEDDILRNLRKSAEINPAQSPQGLRDTIEEQNAQIEALKRDLLEQTAAVRQVAQDNKTETEATRIENARLNNYIERLEVRNAVLVPENARLKAEVDALMTNPTSRLLRAKQAENAVLAIENDSLKAEVERLKAMDSLKTVSLTDSTNWQAIGDYAETKEENARLKTENEELHKDYEALADEHTKLIDRNAHLKADVERLRSAGDEILNGWQSNTGDDVERFTKACWLWITAKEGKPSV